MFQMRAPFFGLLILTLCFLLNPIESSAQVHGRVTTTEAKLISDSQTRGWMRRCFKVIDAGYGKDGRGNSEFSAILAMGRDRESAHTGVRIILDLSVENPDSIVGSTDVPTKSDMNSLWYRTQRFLSGSNSEKYESFKSEALRANGSEELFLCLEFSGDKDVLENIQAYPAERIRTGTRGR